MPTGYDKDKIKNDDGYFRGVVTQKVSSIEESVNRMWRHIDSVESERKTLLKEQAELCEKRRKEIESIKKQFYAGSVLLSVILFLLVMFRGPITNLLIGG
jgi:hypothetical protein